MGEWYDELHSDESTYWEAIPPESLSAVPQQLVANETVLVTVADTDEHGNVPNTSGNGPGDMQEIPLCSQESDGIYGSYTLYSDKISGCITLRCTNSVAKAVFSQQQRQLLDNNDTTTIPVHAGAATERALVVREDNVMTQA